MVGPILLEVGTRKERFDDEVLILLFSRAARDRFLRRQNGRHDLAIHE